MGSGRWDPGAWDVHATATASKPRAAIFTSSRIKDALNPKNIVKRESVDTAGKGDSNPIIICSDVTGSMGSLAEQIIKTEIGKIMKEIYDRKPINDPHILIAANGDAEWDKAPIQVTQFETTMALADQMKDVYIEAGGGGNEGESYNLAWYFAEYLTDCDAITKRGRKGYLFTIGDEPPLMKLKADHIREFFGQGAEGDISSADLYAAASQHWNIFHLIVKPVPGAVKAWKDLIGQHALEVSDVSKLGEIIVSTIQVLEGEDAKTVASSWSGDTSLVVANAIGALTTGKAAAGGVVRM